MNFCAFPGSTWKAGQRLSFSSRKEREWAKADFIATRDARGFAKAKVDALSPAGFFKMLQCDYNLTYDAIDF